jgi:hypothetical protein
MVEQIRVRFGEGVGTIVDRHRRWRGEPGAASNGRRA